MELNLKPSHAKIRDYYTALNQYGQLNISHETAVREAFGSLLDTCARQFKWKLVHEFPISLPKNKRIIVDGALLDTFTLKHGYWEAKDLKDKLENEVKKKLELGYPRNNIIFQSPERAILFQHGVRQGLNEDITSPENLVELLKVFFSYREPQHEEWEKAVEEFTPRIPDIASGVKEILDKERKKNREFVTAFEGFVQLCRQAINPNLSEESVETMLIQHLLTERIFRKVFDNPEFTRRNIIAIEIEKVIKTITDRRFSRDEFLKDLDYFYRAIEDNARNATNYSEKQSFLNTIYERFFQGFSPKQADTHGIVYTPQSIVNFMVRSVEEILKKEFGKSLSDREVHILDPFVGTGNFIVRVLQEIKKTALPYKYANELHCNEIMLLPYYIASMNIEHAYLEATGEYNPFEGICLVDTFELAEQRQAQFGFIAAENLARVQKQKSSPIFIVLGNPPYNAGQQNENDNNKNRDYPGVDERVRETYMRASKARLLRKYRDPYVRALRWASDRIGEEGIVAFVTNSSFIDDNSLDGIRSSLASEFSFVYLLDLGGNVRHNPKLSGTTHNVFGIQLGVSINVLVKVRKQSVPKILYASLPGGWRKEQKYKFLEEQDRVSKINWSLIQPSEMSLWLTGTTESSFAMFTPLTSDREAENAIFLEHGLGISTNRDTYVYNFNEVSLSTISRKNMADYNGEVHRLRETGRNAVDELVDYSRVKWSETLKRKLVSGRTGKFDSNLITKSVYRPFVEQFLYYDELMIDRPSFFKRVTPKNVLANRIICVPVIGGRAAPWCFCTKESINLNLVSIDATQCFPFYIYSEDGSNRRENITGWALNQFRSQYKDKSITKWDIFHYTYGVLHHQEYRSRYAANLKRELPRIPYAPDFHALAKAGKHLTELHVDYEKQQEYPLEHLEKPGAKLDLRVGKMRLSKDKQTLIYNDFLTLTGIPKETYDYRLGNRSALEWVIDQYQVSTDKRSGITNDPNRDDREYILRLIGQVITVSLETVKIVNALPDLGLPREEKAAASSTQ